MSDSSIVKDFLVESYENLDRLDRDLVGLEKNPQDREALAGVFRTIHTIKGCHAETMAISWKRWRMSVRTCSPVCAMVSYDAESWRSRPPFSAWWTRFARC